MNNIKFLGCDVVNLKKIPGSRADFAMKQVLDFVAGQIEHSYRTPDDSTFEFRFDATLSNTSTNNLVVIATFTPRFVHVKNKSWLVGKRKPALVLEMRYRTDAEMTEKLYCDIMKLLSHLGKAALYNNTSDQIYAMRGPTENSTSSTDDKKFGDKVFRPL